MYSHKSVATKLHDKSPSAIHSNSVGKPAVQCKLAIGSANDPLEHEADAVADRVVNMPAPANFIQAKCASCEKEDQHVRTKQSPAEYPGIIQARNESSPTVSDSISSQISSSKGNGSTLESGTRSFMESRFQTDLSGVRIHTGDYAVQMSKSLQAQAFTVGHDIYFNEGRFSPSSSQGKHLLAHELTHTIQQSPGAARAYAIQSTTPQKVQMAGCAGRNGYNCNGASCVAASGRSGRCIWGGITIGCNCRDTSTDEPRPSSYSLPSWLGWILSAAAMAAIVACFASGVCEFGIVVAGLGAATAAAVIAVLNAAGITDSGGEGA